MYSISFIYFINVFFMVWTLSSNVSSVENTHFNLFEWKLKTYLNVMYTFVKISNIIPKFIAYFQQVLRRYSMCLVIYKPN